MFSCYFFLYLVVIVFIQELEDYMVSSCGKKP